MFEVEGKGTCRKENCSFSHDQAIVEAERLRRSKAPPGGPPGKRQGVVAVALTGASLVIGGAPATRHSPQELPLNAHPGVPHTLNNNDHCLFDTHRHFGDHCNSNCHFDNNSNCSNLQTHCHPATWYDDNYAMPAVCWQQHQKGQRPKRVAAPSAPATALPGVQ